MSKYTTEVRDICENFSGLGADVGYYKVNEVIEKSRDKIFNFDFPIFDEKYRSVLETKILKHYYTREIGFETVGLWLLKLDTKLNEIMPYYNKMYNSELLEFNPFHDVNVTRTHSGSEKDVKNVTDSSKNNGKNSGTSKTTQDSTTNSQETNVNRNLYSDTPQGALNGVESETYLTNARKVSDSGSRNSSTDYASDTTNSSTSEYTSTSTNNETVNSTDEYLETVIGKQGTGSLSQMLIKYRETFINIDMMIIEELSDLFMLLW